MSKTIYTLLLGTLFTLPASAQIRLNQVGMFPNQEKTAVIEGAAKSVTITSDATGKKAAKVRVLRTATSPWSKKKRTVVDFSSLNQPGTYTISCVHHCPTGPARCHRRHAEGILPHPLRHAHRETVCR